MKREKNEVRQLDWAHVTPDIKMGSEAVLACIVFGLPVICSVLAALFKVLKAYIIALY